MGVGLTFHTHGLPMPMPSFHYRHLDLHFILTDDWKKVWANAIVSDNE